MTLSELRLIERVLISDTDYETTEALRIIKREIKLRTTDYITGKPIQDKDVK